ncbi:MAG: ribosome biogenesis GTP-binding protein YihA/YsxC [Clostridiales bacterium]|jgi:GTP-binding protein|nr:ribosome biogenesis GTP-binding protein YihA/YsxC [Clostridiales bacterium]
MIVNSAELAACAVRPSQFPTEGLPEIAFIGKSNVGKSSLLNAMAGRKALAKTSSKPGKTRTLNFFNINGKLMFVDLPGYGYAKISKQESAKWGPMAESYLLGRKELKLILMLADIRHDPSPLDIAMLEWLDHFSFTRAIIATKSDKIGRPNLSGRISSLRKGFGLGQDAIIMPFSATSKAGFNELWDFILKKI